MRLDELLPVLREIDDRYVAMSIAHASGTVTCRKGCSACCEIQPVPLTPPEAYAISLIVEQRPELRPRFEQGAQILEKSGIADFFRHSLPTPDAGGVVGEYLGLKIACPFLEGNCCSIYSSRPFACREYVVTSPAERCRAPLTEAVECVPMMLNLSAKALQAAAFYVKKPQLRVPMILALEYVEQHREELEAEFANADEFVRHCLT